MLPAQDHCTVTWVLHPGGEARYYLSLVQVHDINTAQLREPGSCTPLIGQWTKMSTRDDNFGHTRLNSPLKLWKETLRRPRSPTCTIGLMVKAFQRLKDGKTARSSSASQTMMNRRQNRQVLFR